MTPTDTFPPTSPRAIRHTKAVAIKGGNTGVADHSQSQITAKGSGYLAERILNIAFESGVKVRQDKALTDILSAYEVESPIPLEALSAVSTILEHVYKANLAEKIRRETNHSDKVTLSDDTQRTDSDNKPVIDL